MAGLTPAVQQIARSAMARSTSCGQVSASCSQVVLVQPAHNRWISRTSVVRAMFPSRELKLAGDGWSLHSPPSGARLHLSPVRSVCRQARAAARSPLPQGSARRWDRSWPTTSCFLLPERNYMWLDAWSWAGGRPGVVGSGQKPKSGRIPGSRGVPSGLHDGMTQRGELRGENGLRVPLVDSRCRGRSIGIRELS